MNTKVRSADLPFEMRSSRKKTLKKYREEAGLRAEDVAVRLGVSINAVWGWERGSRLPKNPVTRASYLKLLGVSA